MVDGPLTLMAVHAHPDDEAAGTGGILARYAAEGIRTVLVTCTDGGCGDGPGGVKPGEQGHDPAAVVAVRQAELEASCAVLNVTHLELLGYADSGMQGWPANDAPGSFWRTPVAEAADRLAELMQRYRPDVVVTYDANGFYGHPDHIQAHRVTTAAFDAAGDPAYAPALGEPWQTSRLYHTAIPDAFLQRALELGVLPADESQRPRGIPDSEIDAVIDGTAQMGAKVAAMRAHRSQIDLTQGLWHALVAAPEFAIENYVLASGDRLPGDGEHGWQSDLFAKE